MLPCRLEVPSPRFPILTEFQSADASLWVMNDLFYSLQSVFNASPYSIANFIANVLMSYMHQIYRFRPSQLKTCHVDWDKLYPFPSYLICQNEVIITSLKSLYFGWLLGIVMSKTLVKRKQKEKGKHQRNRYHVSYKINKNFGW